MVGIQFFQLDPTTIGENLVTSFNGLKGPITLSSSDVTTALGFNLTSAYDIIGGMSGAFTSNQIIQKIPNTRSLSFVANLTGSVAIVDVAPTADAVFSLQKNGTQFATITFSAATTTGVFAGVLTTFVSGDILSIVAPSTVDSTLSGVWFTLSGTLA